jgi:hypothetical protein
MRSPVAIAVPWLVVVALAWFTLAAPAHAAPLDQGPGGPVLVISGDAPGWASYYSEILRNEGLNEFDTASIAGVTPSVLAGHDVAILGLADITPAQATMLGDWVQAGGNLITMLPDPDLDGLLGITGSTGQLSDAYLKIDTSAAPGAGLVGDTIQYHGFAERYGLAGATPVATLYSDATTATANPAVTLRSVGANGGQAAAFAYELSKSVVYTRQGNPAWAGQERDGTAPIRPDDLFFGAKAGDPQPDWVNLGKVAIPQADEQQRLLANLIEKMESDRTPLPRFWYLPHGSKAAVVMTGDDHGNGGTAGRFDQYAGLSAPGCSVAEWECVRGTSYVYPNTPLTNAQVAAYQAAGFEIALHPATDPPAGCADYNAAQYDAFLTNQLAALAAAFPSVTPPVTNRNHCIAWSGWTTTAAGELAHGIRLDTNYYFWPPAWVQDRPGMFTGSGLPMRFADVNGTMLDVYQAATQMTDESGQNLPATIAALLDKALGPEGYYGAFTANMHTDSASSAGSDAIVAAAQSRGVPVVSAKQLLTWTDARNASSFGAIAYSGHTLTFTVDHAAGANGLRAMVPATAPAGGLTAIKRNGSPVSYTTQVIKGVSYAFVDAASGSYEASYAPEPSHLTDTTTTDFGLGAGDTHVANGAGGELTLQPALDEDFSGASLPAGWTSSPWTGGAATVSGGNLVVNGALASTTATFGPSRALEFRATFGAETFQHAGFAQDLNSVTNWAMFSTFNTTGTLFARSALNGATIDTPLPGVAAGLPHLFRIVWNPSSVAFSVDGVLVATHTVSITAAMHVVASDFTLGGPDVKVDSVRMSPYASPGTFTSRVLDAGSAVDWDKVTWTADTPAGTGVAIEVRRGSTPAPDGSWTAFAPVAASGDPIGGHTRYIQYRATLTTSDPATTPVLSDVTFTYDDTTPPETQIDSGPSGATTDATPTFAFSSPDDPTATFACRVDAAAFAPCTSPLTTATLADGPHTFEVRATDPSGNLDATPASLAFTVDTTAPATVIDTATTATSDTTPSFAFHSADGSASFFCRADGQPFAACSSPATVGPLADGSHTFEAFAKDGAGNVGPTASHAFVVDTVAPVVTIDSGPSGTTTSASPQFAFHSSEPGTLLCRIDAGAFASCSSPATFGPLPNGPHSFEVTAIDAAGNTGSASRAFDVEVPAADTTPPVVTVSHTAQPSGWNGASPVALTITSTEGTPTCTDNGTPLVGSSVAGEGFHNIVCSATDAAGNVSAPASDTVAIDTIAPALTVGHTANGAGWNTTNVTLDIHAADNGSGVDGSPACTDNGAPLAGTVVSGEGVHAIHCTVSDHVPHTTTADDTVYIDHTPPAVAIQASSKPADPTTSTSGAFVFSVSDVGTQTSGLQPTVCRLDGNVIPCTSATTMNLSGLSVGAHTFRVEASDYAGNQASDSYTWHVTSPPSGGAPVVTVNWPKEGGRYSVDKGVTVDWSCTAANGVASQSSSTPNGQDLPAVLGTGQAFTATCTDTNGQSTSKTVHYTMGTFDEIVNDDSPIAYYRLGEAAGDDRVRDDSGNHHDGEAKNATAWEEFGISGDGDSARRFLGDGGYVYVNDIHAPQSALTLGGWVRFDDTGDAEILDHGYDAGIYLADGHLHFRMLGTTVTDPGTVDADTWYFVAGTWSGGRMRLWKATGDVNPSTVPVAVASATQSKRPSGISTFYIGYGQDVPWLRGVMDEVFYYDKALSTAHLAELWLADPPARPRQAAASAGAPAPAASDTSTATPATVSVQSRSTDTASQARAKAKAKAKARAKARAKALAKAKARAKAKAKAKHHHRA